MGLFKYQKVTKSVCKELSKKKYLTDILTYLPAHIKKALIDSGSLAGMIKRKTAFTLAQVLITLTIIGIVAALTVPALVGKYKEKQRITQLQKAYSILTQAFNMAVNENGTVDNWNLTYTYTGEADENGSMILDSSGQVEFANKLRPYIKKTSVKTIKREGSYSLDGRQFGQDSIPTADRYNGNDSYRIVLSDGTEIVPGWIEKCKSNGFCGPLWIALPEKNELQV